MMAPQTAKPRARTPKAVKEPAKPKPVDEDSAMRRIGIGKVVINIGVGKSGEAVERARKVLEQITSQKPSSRKSKKSNYALSVGGDCLIQRRTGREVLDEDV